MLPNEQKITDFSKINTHIYQFYQHLHNEKQNTSKYSIFYFSNNQSILHFFLLSWKRKDTETLKSSTCNKLLVVDTTCFDECFSFHVRTRTHWIYKSLLLFWGFFQPPCSCVLWRKCFEKSPYFMLSTITVQSWYQISRINLSYIILIKFP